MRVTKSGVSVVQSSKNSKLSKHGTVAATWASVVSCLTSCAFYRKCYPYKGTSAFTTNRINRSPILDAETIARNEANGIDLLGIVGRMLRLHVVGDCPNETCARIVADACKRYIARCKGLVWGYTHAWRSVSADTWRNAGVSMLASCETPKEVKIARSIGWACAIVVPEFWSIKRHNYHGINVIPCPNQTKKSVTCEECKLCTRADWLKENKLTIAFSVHNDTDQSLSGIIRAKLERDGYSQRKRASVDRDKRNAITPEKSLLNDIGLADSILADCETSEDVNVFDERIRELAIYSPSVSQTILG